MLPFYGLSRLSRGKALTFILKGSLSVWAALLGVQLYPLRRGDDGRRSGFRSTLWALYSFTGARLLLRRPSLPRGPDRLHEPPHLPEGLLGPASQARPLSGPGAPPGDVLLVRGQVQHHLLAAPPRLRLPPLEDATGPGSSSRPSSPSRSSRRRSSISTSTAFTERSRPSPSTRAS